MLKKMEKNLAPIALFVYNRPEHTKRTIEALKKNDLANKSDLFVFSDAPKSFKDKQKVNEVRAYLKKIKGFRKVKIIQRKQNFGLANSIIKGVTSIINKYGKIIVLEDDLITSPYFLRYMNSALDLYKNEPKVGAISAYFYNVKKELSETFFLYYFNCWGWATWKDRWNLFEQNGKKLFFDLKKRRFLKLFNVNNTYPFSRILRNQIKGNNDSWAIRWYATLLLNKKLTLYPKKSLVENIGFDNTGVHSQKRDIFKTKLSKRPIKIKKILLEQNSSFYKELQKFFKNIRYERIFKKIKRTLRNPFKELKNL